MSTWGLLQVVVDIFAALGFFVIIMRMSRQPKDDPRLSRGLQLLQSKISVLEDLSDRTEMQVTQLTALLDQKAKEVQAKIQLAERSVHEIKVSMDNSLEVAKIFQDKIPHQEIIERQNTIKYVQAARLAHQGATPEEIQEQVDLPKGEIEFIAKVNRDQLMFDENQLPSWAKSVELTPPSAMEPIVDSETQAARLRAEIEIAEGQRLVDNLSRLQFEMQSLDIQLARESTTRDLSGAFETPKVETSSLQKLGEEFRKACEDANLASPRNSIFPPLDQLTSMIPQMFVDEVNEMPAVPVQVVPQPQAAPVMPAPQPVVDPVMARAAAQAKVQAAMSRTSAQPPAGASSGSSELEAARALAAAHQQPAHVINSRSPNGAPPVIRKVEFPRIDGGT